MLIVFVKCSSLVLNPMTVLRVFNYLLTVDSECSAVLALIDLAAAFDTVHHNMLVGKTPFYGNLNNICERGLFLLPVVNILLVLPCVVYHRALFWVLLCSHYTCYLWDSLSRNIIFPYTFVLMTSQFTSH